MQVQRNLKQRKEVHLRSILEKARGIAYTNNLGLCRGTHGGDADHVSAMNMDLYMKQQHLEDSSVAVAIKSNPFAAAAAEEEEEEEEVTMTLQWTKKTKKKKKWQWKWKWKWEEEGILFL